MGKHEKTSERIGKAAGKRLGDSNTPNDVKSIVGSVLTHTPEKKTPKIKHKKKTKTRSKNRR